MAIFGHMTAKGPQKEGPGGTSPVSPPTDTETKKKDVTVPSVGESPELVTSSAMQDLETTLNELTQEISDTLKSTTDKKKVEEPPHFTIATSPTRPHYQEPSTLPTRPQYQDPSSKE